MPKLIDLTGQKFGKLTVIKRDISKKGVYWLCKCDCGNIKSILSSNLRRGLTQSCGCLQKQRTGENNVKNLVGQRFGKLTVVERDQSRIGGNAYWLCKCDCGNEELISVSSSHLSTGHTKSCGCWQKAQTSKTHIKDRIGNIYGKLTVLSREQSYNNRTRWLCQCACGNKTIVSGNHLDSGNTISCGCINSKGELKISQLLMELEIPFIKQKSFPDLLGNFNKPLRFDFFLPDKNICIEYQGIQHYINNDFFGAEEAFEQRKNYDNMKREYCKNNKIKLIEIPYTDYIKLNTTMLKRLID